MKRNDAREVELNRDRHGRYWLPIEIEGRKIEAVLDTGLVGETAPTVLVTQKVWADVEPALRNRSSFRGVTGKGDEWKIETGIGRIRVPGLDMELETRIGAPANNNTVGSFFVTSLKNAVMTLDCDAGSLIIRRSVSMASE